jgi:hypothetical protein
VKQSANILNGWSTTPNRALAAFWLKMSAENDPQYARLFKRFYGRLTTFDRLEYEKTYRKLSESTIILPQF